MIGFVDLIVALYMHMFMSAVAAYGHVVRWRSHSFSLDPLVPVLVTLHDLVNYKPCPFVDTVQSDLVLI